MEFNDYQEQIKELDLYPEGFEGTLALALGIGNEAGEVQGIFKKYVRDGYYDIEKLKAELGDVLWYVASIARRSGLTMEDVAGYNIYKLFGRLERGTLRGSGDDR